MAVVIGVSVSALDAHFRLVSPTSWLIEDMGGDPQKIGPCGGSAADAGLPSGAMMEVQGGQSLYVAAAETIFHPGHYRIALARSRDALPPDPEVTMQDTEQGPRSLSAVIAENPVPPVLVDGLWPHTERPAPELWETDIVVPNMNCEDCVLQVIQFMANHPGVREGGFSYHPCADLRITANPNLPLDNRW